MKVEIHQTEDGIRMVASCMTRTRKTRCRRGTRVDVEMQTSNGEWSTIDSVLILHPRTEKEKSK